MHLLNSHKGITLVEIMVAMVLLIIVVSGFWTFFTSISASDKITGVDQEYQQLLNQLQQKLLNDIRCAAKINEITPTHWQFTLIHFDDESSTETLTIDWEYDETAKLVTRRESEGVKNYDFSPYCPSEKFVFSLSVK
jgi:type II secretory pathway component PulJ